MKNADTFISRRQDADAAKARRLDKFKANPLQDSTGALARAAVRQAQTKVQVERRAIEATATEERRQAEVKAAADARIAEDQQLLRTAEIAEASRKAKRDSRYANRKAGKSES